MQHSGIDEPVAVHVQHNRGVVDEPVAVVVAAALGVGVPSAMMHTFADFAAVEPVAAAAYCTCLLGRGSCKEGLDVAWCCCLIRGEFDELFCFAFLEIMREKRNAFLRSWCQSATGEGGKCEPQLRTA